MLFSFSVFHQYSPQLLFCRLKHGEIWDVPSADFRSSFCQNFFPAILLGVLIYWLVFHAWRSVLILLQQTFCHSSIGTWRALTSFYSFLDTFLMSISLNQTQVQIQLRMNLLEDFEWLDPNSSASTRIWAHREDSSGMLSRVSIESSFYFFGLLFLLNCFLSKKINAFANDWVFWSVERFQIYVFLQYVLLPHPRHFKISKKPRNTQSAFVNSNSGIVLFDHLRLTCLLISWLIWMRLICWGYVRKRSVGTKRLEWPLKFSIELGSFYKKKIESTELFGNFKPLAHFGIIIIRTWNSKTLAITGGNIVTDSEKTSFSHTS